MPQADADTLNLQLQDQRRSVDFDTFDIHTQQLIAMLERKQIWIAPAYQRQFRWDPKRCSQLIESLLLGIPVPSLFMATNKDSTWEVVDGVQRLGAIVKFAGSQELRERLRLDGPHMSAELQKGPLVLCDLQKLKAFTGLTFEELPANLKLHFETRPIKVVTLTDKSDLVVRYDLFERLNTGGIALTFQEIRDCVYKGTFANKLEEWAQRPDFRTVVRLTPAQSKDGTGEECVLRYFAFLHRYKEFRHSVKDFLDHYMKSASESFDYEAGDASFTKTFSQLAKAFPDGLRRPGGKQKTPLNLYEGVSVGAALALQKAKSLKIDGIAEWLKSPDLRSYTTGATNDPTAVKNRIEFCRDRFLGKPYVQKPAD